MSVSHPASIKKTLNEPSKMAAECSPGRKPGVCVHFFIQLSPARGGRGNCKDSCRLLRGLTSFSIGLNPGLTPGATLRRSLRELVELFISALTCVLL
jgi:hypothetical protein